MKASARERAVGGGVSYGEDNHIQDKHKSFFHTLPISALSEPTVLFSAVDTSVLWYDGATISDMEG